ncbi:hypothetical protein [Phytomonospora endophytica]|uniref:Uncharacterized protein n=1 Tax=Phytomonospora endophytica TaxID=714109 RepID=A0A841FH31_9ACTN|nr:hypothetical protein [Phytomonospora endophytica]MBB6032407.1 hypothetical protein [Phytomonospora endophytica]GIG71379.1 hypothetical protein Pen01_76740 [Phytomonospora endophytica]
MSESSAQAREGRKLDLRALPVWSFSVIIAGVTALALLFAQSSQGADPRTAMAVGIDLTIDDAPELGVGGFSGAWVTAGTPDLSQSNGEDNGDYSDPDGVKTYAGAATQLVHTSWDATSGQLTARANATAFTLKWNGVSPFITIGSLDAYAQCVKQNAILAYSRSNTGIVMVAGMNFTEGTRTVTVTGPQLGLPSGVTGTMTVDYEQFESVINTATEASAEAYVEVSVSVDLRNADGSDRYSGRILNMVLGHVEVSCQPRIMPSPSSSSASPTANPTGSPSPTITPHSITPTPSSESPSPSPSSESPSPSPSSESPSPSPSPSPSSESPSPSPTTESPSPTESPSSSSPVPSPTDSSSGGSSGRTTPPASPPDDDDDDGLAVTGSTVFLVMLGGVGVSMLGVAFLALARHRRESRP